LKRTLYEREFRSQQIKTRIKLHFILSKKEKGPKREFRKKKKRQLKADHKDPQNTPPNVANFGVYFGRRLRRKTARRINETVEAGMS
jgi:hypothetical protein